MTTTEEASSHYHDHGGGPAPGETAEQHAAHAYFQPIRHWGLGRKQEAVLFYFFAIPSCIFAIAAAVLGSYHKTYSYSFIATATVWLVLWATAWLQTAVLMVQRASWTRDEANLKDRKQYLYLSVRLQRLQVVRALFGPCHVVIRIDSLLDSSHHLSAHLHPGIRAARHHP